MDIEKRRAYLKKYYEEHKNDPKDLRRRIEATKRSRKKKSRQIQADRAEEIRSILNEAKDIQEAKNEIYAKYKISLRV